MVVVGSANVDLSIYTEQLPRPGETIFGRDFHLGFGGKGANQAVAAALCGGDVSMVARVGDDLFGQATIDNFRSKGIDASNVWITEGRPSGVAPIFVDSSGQNRIIVVKGANDDLTAEDIERASDLLVGADCIVLQLEAPVETVYYTLRFARESGVRTILNPAPAQKLDAARASLADYLIPNETEAEALTGLPVTNLEEARLCARRLVSDGFAKVIVTLGANGALAADAEGERHIPPYPVEPKDTSGAGDAFIGSFATFLTAGYAEDEAIARANVYAALSTQNAGTQMSFPTKKQLESAWAARARRSQGA